MNELAPMQGAADDLIPLAAIVGVFTFLTVASVSGAVAAWAIARIRAETIRHAIDSGLAPAALATIPAPMRDLRRGVLLLALGAGTTTALAITGGAAAAAFGAIPIALGGGWVITSRLMARAPSA